MRYWTVAEANDALARVTALVERAREAASEVADHAEATRERAKGNGHPLQTDPPAGSLEAIADELAADGIVLRDLETGLVDFPAEASDGRLYWLCWRLGEDAVAWWHWPEDGFAGRRPISEAP
jgi:hypothetical protein